MNKKFQIIGFAILILLTSGCINTSEINEFAVEIMKNGNNKNDDGDDGTDNIIDIITPPDIVVTDPETPKLSPPYLCDKDEILSSMDLKKEFVIGIDETGRGENYGPMVIAGVLADTNSLRQIRDSKKTSYISKKEKIVSEKMLGSVVFTLNSELIDLARNSGKNLNQIEASLIEKISESLSIFADSKTKVDGAPLKVRNKKIEFIPKGDDLEPVIGAASIIAKHTRNNSSDKRIRKTWKKKN